MKYEWEPQDVQPGVKFNVSGGEIWTIGYGYINDDKVYHCLSMSDFMVTTYNSKAALAESLTARNAKPC